MALKQTTSCLGYQQLTALSTAQSLTVPPGATYALIQAEAQAVRWRDDGTAPTAAVGMNIAAGTQVGYDGNLSRIQFIESTPSAKLNVSFYA